MGSCQFHQSAQRLTPGKGAAANDDDVGGSLHSSKRVKLPAHYPDYQESSPLEAAYLTDNYTLLTCNI